MSTTAVSNKEFLAFLESSPKHREALLDFQKAKEAEAERKLALATQTEFTLSDGSVVSLTVLEMMAYSSLGGKQADKDQSAHGVVKSEAWEILKAVKAVKKDYFLTPDGFRARVAK